MNVHRLKKQAHLCSSFSQRRDIFSFSFAGLPTWQRRTSKHRR